MIQLDTHRSAMLERLSLAKLAKPGYAQGRRFGTVFAQKLASEDDLRILAHTDPEEVLAFAIPEEALERMARMVDRVPEDLIDLMEDLELHEGHIEGFLSGVEREWHAVAPHLEAA